MGGLPPGPHELTIHELDNRSPTRRTVIDHTESRSARSTQAREYRRCNRNPLQDRLCPVDEGHCLSVIYGVRRPNDGVTVQGSAPSVDPHTVVLEPRTLKKCADRDVHMCGLRVAQLKGIVHRYPHVWPTVIIQPVLRSGFSLPLSD